MDFEMCLQLASLAHLGSLSMLRCSEVTRTSRTGSRRKAGIIFATRAAHQLQVYIVLMPWLLRMDLCALFYARLRIYTHTYKRMCAGVFGAGNYLQVGGWVYTPCMHMQSHRLSVANKEMISHPHCCSHVRQVRFGLCHVAFLV